ncbi:MAG: PKD domain-containing protein, partial [Chitinophagales bacterium]|nr:PKD domain-containing protein [Chitinophagales bacterium]MDW8274513.1 PKD domain-containing protein [Chitinophagales bacterium]
MREYFFIWFCAFLFVINGIQSQPVASFVPDRTSGCAGLFQVNFTNTSTGATSYLWDLGDGDFTNDINPSKIYLSPGTKTITLIAYNGSQSDTARATIISFRPPQINFTLNRDTACVNSPVCTNQSIVLGDAPLDPTKCFWDFGLPPTLR